MVSPNKCFTGKASLLEEQILIIWRKSDFDQCSIVKPPGLLSLLLWGGECRKICWVNWEMVCKKREKGGLGIKDINAFNLALLGKWRWRFFTEKEVLW